MRHAIHRRDFLKWVGAGTATVSLPAVFGCRSGTALGLSGGASGAHSDIAKPEVAHAFWEGVACAE